MMKKKRKYNNADLMLQSYPLTVKKINSIDQTALSVLRWMFETTSSRVGAGKAARRRSSASFLSQKSRSDLILIPSSFLQGAFQPKNIEIFWGSRFGNLFYSSRDLRALMCTNSQTSDYNAKCVAYYYYFFLFFILKLNLRPCGGKK